MQERTGNSTYVVIKNEDTNEFICTRKKGYGRRSNFDGLPGGGQEGMETARQTATRELSTELNINLDEWIKKGTVTQVRSNNNGRYQYFVLNLKGVTFNNLCENIKLGKEVESIKKLYLDKNKNRYLEEMDDAAEHNSWDRSIIDDVNKPRNDFVGAELPVTQQIKGKTKQAIKPQSQTQRTSFWTYPAQEKPEEKKESDALRTQTRPEEQQVKPPIKKVETSKEKATPARTQEAAIIKKSEVKADVSSGTDLSVNTKIETKPLSPSLLNYSDSDNSPQSPVEKKSRVDRSDNLDQAPSSQRVDTTQQGVDRSKDHTSNNASASKQSTERTSATTANDSDRNLRAIAAMLTPEERQNLQLCKNPGDASSNESTSPSNTPKAKQKKSQIGV